jgi:hypothetical protein
MNPITSAELSRSRIEDLRRNAQRDRLVRDARRARREQRHSGSQAASSHSASVLTRYALALFGAAAQVPPGEGAAARRNSPRSPRVIRLRKARRGRRQRCLTATGAAIMREATPPTTQ